ncbi:cytochrome c-type protein [Campylobacter sp. 19-13652]|nr:cytochrome c-type protein [Campylobacter sp. 19-13652]
MIILVAGFCGFLLVLPTHYALEKTSDDKFCAVCHEMAAMSASYAKDTHSGANKSGVSAKCVDCHLPHTSLARYVLQKAKNGIVEGYIHFFGDPDSIDWVKNLKNREHYVFDSGCLSCHTKVLENELLPTKAKQMHAHYKELLGTQKEIKCASCHVGVGHNFELRNELEYQKPTYKIYEKKMKELRGE